MFHAGARRDSDKELALRWLMLAAKAGNALGQRLLGDFFLHGDHGKRDRAIAEEWYARAANQGDATAQDMLSSILTDAAHRKPDYEQARHWALRAAEHGVAASMTRLGSMYNDALGVERDPKKPLNGGERPHSSEMPMVKPCSALRYISAQASSAIRSPHWLGSSAQGCAQQNGGQVLRGSEQRVHAGTARRCGDAGAFASWRGGGRAMIIGTAGHIDHGKTSLIKRLTGIDTDRLKEEKARGISIDLGFAYWPRPNGAVIGFVDVPGHEGLVHNMLAGATGIDFVMLVIAADDGVMPQTREHLAIMDLLGLEHGIVALNKCDLVDENRLIAVMGEIEALLADTSLKGAEIIPVSAVTGAGLDQLAARIDAALETSAKKSTEGLFRLAVDRSFALTGHGTTVTGTVLSGAVRVGDQLMISPAGLEARVRSIHAQNKPVDAGEAGQRCALVLSGPKIDKEAVRRGDMVVDPRLHAPSSRIDARFRC